MKLLEEYAKEIGLESISLSQLIESHRYLRSLNLGWRNTFKEAREQGRKYGEYLGKMFVLEHEYISIERLRNMTLAEICKVICD